MGRKLVSIAVILVSAFYLVSHFQGEPQIEAEFEVSGMAQEGRIPFKVHLHNVGSAAAEDLSIVATAGEAVQHFDAPILKAGEEKTVEGELFLGEGTSSSVEFSARVLGDQVSYRSETVMVAQPEGLGGSRLYSQVQQAQSKVIGPDQMGTSFPEIPGPEPDMAFGTLEEVDPKSDVQDLISRVESQECGASQHTLEIYQQIGNEQAGEFLVSHL